MSRPQEMRALTYGTYTPVLASLDAVRGPLRELIDAIDDIEGAISTDRPLPEKMTAAREAWERVPRLALAFEEAVAPRRVETLLRRIARMRGVDRRTFSKRSGLARFD